MLGTIPKDDKGFAFMSSVLKALGGTLDDMGSRSDAHGKDLIMKTFDEKWKNEMQHLFQAYPPASSSQACANCSPVCTPHNCKTPL